MIKCTEGLDPYKQLASRYYNVPYENVTIEQRQKAKGATYLLMYDAKERTIEEYLASGMVLLSIMEGYPND